MLLDQTQLSPSLAKSEWKKPPFEVCLKLCIKTVPAGAFSASIDLPSRHWERTAVDMQIISLVPPSPLPTLPYHQFSLHHSSARGFQMELVHNYILVLALESICLLQS